MINHLDGSGITALLKSPQTFPEGFWIGSTEFSDWGRASTLRRAADLVTMEIDVLDGEVRRESVGAWVAFDLWPESEATRSFSAFPLSEHNVGRRTSITRASGLDKIALSVDFDSDGSELILTGGTVIRRDLRPENHQYIVFFSDFHKE